METTTIKIASMTRVRSALPGVAKAEAALTPGQAMVEFDTTQVSRAALCTVGNGIGFEAV